MTKKIRQVKSQYDKLQADKQALEKLKTDLEKLEADRQKIMDKKSQIPDNKNIDKQLENSELVKLLQDNQKEFPYLINIIKTMEPLKKQITKLNKFIRKYYD